MGATRFILVRHGETEWNRKGIFRGRADVPLNAHGRAQARAAARALADRPIAAIYASPSGRTVETARAVQRRTGTKRLVVVPDLCELDRGLWQGLTREQARRRFPKVYRDWYEHPAQARFPKGESLQAVQKRALGAFERLRRSCPGETALLVSHNVVLRALLCGLLEIPLDRFQCFDLAPASISELAFERGHFRIRSLNDRGHLRRLTEASGAPAD